MHYNKFFCRHHSKEILVPIKLMRNYLMIFFYFELQSEKIVTLVDKKVTCVKNELNTHQRQKNFICRLSERRKVMIREKNFHWHEEER